MKLKLLIVTLLIGTQAFSVAPTQQEKERWTKLGHEIEQEAQKKLGQEITVQPSEKSLASFKCGELLAKQRVLMRRLRVSSLSVKERQEIENELANTNAEIYRECK